MPHDAHRPSLPGPGTAIFSLLVTLPLVAEAQGSATIQAQATVLSAEATRAWQAVARRLEAPGDSGQSAGPAAPYLLATITEASVPADGQALPARRTITVEFLSN